jgi:hypothetical protein
MQPDGGGKKEDGRQKLDTDNTGLLSENFIAHSVYG